MSETAVTAKRRSQALALPNLLTYGRVAAVPVVAGLLLGFTENWARWAALAVFIAAGVTDFLDGYFARIWQQQSPLGRMLDPIADKLLVATTLMALVALLYFGGEALSGFAICMIFGILIGTYSSIYVAAPILLLWGVRRGREGEKAAEAPQPVA